MINYPTRGTEAGEAARSMDHKASEEPGEVKHSDWAWLSIRDWGMKQNAYISQETTEGADQILKMVFAPYHLSKTKSQLCVFASKNMRLFV